MNGQRHYNHIDHTADIDRRNIGPGRPSPIGTCIHTTSGTNSLEWLLTGAALNGAPASADYLISTDGTQHELCPTFYYPYHAGKSRLVYNGLLYQGDEVSRLLLGVELECIDNGYITSEQEDSLADVIVTRGLQYGWRWPYYLVGHYEIARPVGRRSDPQGLNWGNLMGRLYVRGLTAHVAGL